MIGTPLLDLSWKNYRSLMSDISFTFGIITVYEDKQRLDEIINSIRSLGIPSFEILIVGGGDSSGIDGQDIVKIDFDESIKPRWITRKKNILVLSFLQRKVIFLVFQHYF